MAVAVGAGAACGAGDEGPARVLGTSVDATSTTVVATSTTVATADAEVSISATSVVRGTAGAAGVPPTAPVGPPPSIATSPGGKPDQAPGGTTPPASELLTVAEVQAAIGSGDFCGIYRSLARLDVSGADAERFRRDLLVVLDLMEDATSEVPAELAAAWLELRAGSERVVELLGRDGAAVAEAAAVYRDERFLAATEQTDAWAEANCAA